MKAILSVGISRKEFITAKYKDMGEEIPNKKVITKEMKEYLLDSLFEIVEDWVTHSQEPNISFKGVRK